MIGYLKFTRISEEQIQKLENRFELSSWKTMIVSKISYGLGSAFMATSGASGMPFGRFLEYTLSLDFIRSSLLLAIGFYFGKAAVHLGPTYLKYYMIAVIILVPAIYFIYRKKLRNPKNK